MKLRRIVLALAAIALSGIAAATDHAPSRIESSYEEGVPVVVRGTVDFVVRPFGFVLTDGTEVEFGPDTEWAGVASVAGLQPGDDVVVAGRRDVATLLPNVVAGGVRVVSGNGRIVPVGSPVCLPPRFAKVRASARSISVFGSATSQRTVPGRLVTSDENIEDGGVDDGDSAGQFRDDAEGESTGSGNRGGIDFESFGVLTELRPPARFILSDRRTYLVDGLTEFEDPIISYAGLAIGQYLDVKAVYEGGGVYRAVEITYEGAQNEGQGYVRLEGMIETVSATSLVLTDGTVIRLASTTVFNGDADRTEDMWPGWRAEVYALRNDSGDLIARSVRCDDLELATTVGQEFEPHEAVVILADGVETGSVAERHDARVSGVVSSKTVLFNWEREIDDTLIAELEGDPEIEAVEPNYLFRDPESVRRRFVIVDLSPTDPEYTEQAAAIRHGVSRALAVADGSGAVVAVIDTGVDHCHPLLAGHLIGGGLDLVDGDLAPWETDNGLDEDGDGEIDEAVGHGTFVASLVALAAPGAKILPYRVLDDDGGGTAFNLAVALADAIERGVDVINLSLAYHKRSTAVDLLLEEAEQRGIVVVAAAGNDAGATLPFPAIDSHVLAVTALRSDGLALADFANRADKAVVAAIGEEVYGGLYEGEYGESSGTSLSAPFAAAGAALAKARDPGVSPDIVRLLLIQTGVAVVDGEWSGSSLDLGEAMLSIKY